MKTATFVFFLATVVLALPSCAPVPVQSGGEPEVLFADPIVVDDLHVEETFGDFGLADIVEFEEAQYGVQLRYLSKASTVDYVDVYVYPLYQSEMVSLADALEYELYRLNAEIDQAWDEPQREPSALTRSYYPRFQGDSPGGLLSVRTVGREGNDYRTHSFLTIYNDAILKVRMSVDAGEVFPIESFEAIVDGVYGAINLQDRVPRELGVVVAGHMVMEASEGQSCVLAAWLIYGLKLTAEIGQQHYLNTVEREASARKVAIDFWSDKEEKPDDQPCESRYMDQLSLVSSAGFLSEHVFHHYGRPYSTMTDELRVREYLEWARVNLGDYAPVHSPGILVNWK